MVEAFIHQAADYLGADAWLVTSAMSLAVWITMRTSARVVVGAITGRWLPVGDLAVAILNHMTQADQWTLNTVNKTKQRVVNHLKRINIGLSDRDVYVGDTDITRQLNRHERRLVLKQAKKIQKALEVAASRNAREKAISLL